MTKKSDAEKSFTAKDGIIFFIKGWFITIVFTIIFASFEWITVQETSLPLAHITVPIFVATIIWVIIRVTYVLIFTFVVIMTSFLWLFGTGMVFAFVGWAVFKVVGYVFTGVILPTEDQMLLAFMGFFYSCTILIDEEVRQSL
ncbi:MAG: hypothetical protein ACPGO5_02435 [Patescibacteria group bacterium]